MAGNISSPFNGNLNGTTGNQQMGEPYGDNTQSGSFLGQYTPNGEGNKIGDVDAVTGLINRMVDRALVETWQYEVPYLKYMRQLPVDMVQKVVQVIAPKVGKSREFDPYDAGRLIERQYPKNEQRTYAINFERQYMVSISIDLLKRGGSVDEVMQLVGQQIQNNLNLKNSELTEKINDVVANFIALNQDRLINIQFTPADPSNPTEKELTDLSAKIDAVNMQMTRFVGSDFALSDVGYITKPEDLVIDTTVQLPAQLKNKVFPYAFNDSYFTYSGGATPRGDGRNSDRINVMRYLPDGVWGFVRDKNMLTIGQALNEVNADPTGVPYTRSYNVVHNYWGAIFMDVFKRGYMISTLPDNFPSATNVSLSSISANITNQLGASVNSYSLSSPSALNLVVTPSGSITPSNRKIALPSGHHVDITIVDSNGNQVKKTANTNVDDLDRINLQKSLTAGSVVTFNITSNYVNPNKTVDGKQPQPLTTSTTLKIVE